MPKPDHSPSLRGHRARAAGRLAERATLWLMWLRGWDIIAHNLKVGRFEMDLLLARGAELRLVEVKARRPGAWTAADTALSYAQRLRLQLALRTYLDRVPWPGNITFQRVSWAGRRVRFQALESWDALKIQR